MTTGRTTFVLLASLLCLWSHPCCLHAFTVTTTTSRRHNVAVRPQRSPFRTSSTASSRLFQSSSASSDDGAARREETAFDAARKRALLRQSKKQDSPSSPTGIPSYKAILLFVSTTILIWLSEPLLSLVDTTIVGRCCSLSALAALGPATMVIDNLIYLTYFLSIATTSKMAKALAQRDYKELRMTASHILGVAGVLGMVVSAVVFGLGTPLLTWSAGTSATPQLVASSLEYSKIRCALAPLSIMGMVSQSICLAVRDTTTPILAVIVASLVNTVGDLALVPKLGLKGAAVATAAASVASTLVLLFSVKRKTKEWKDLAHSANGINGSGTFKVPVNGNNTMCTTTSVIDGKPVLHTTNTSSLAATANDTTTAAIKAAKQKKSTDIPFISLPRRQKALELVQLAGPIFFVLVGKVICYSSMTLKATKFGLQAIATHNIMMRVFFFHAVFGDSLNQTGQTFLPSTLLGKDRTSFRRLLKRMVVLAGAIGVYNWVSTLWILHSCGSLITKNAGIIDMMRHHASPMALATLLHSFVMVFEGSIIATGDLHYLVKTYVVTMAILFGQLYFATPNFGRVWTAFCLFQFLRLIQFKSRVVSRVLLRKDVHTT